MRHRGPSQIQFWFIALVIGITAGFMALGFRKGIAALQALVYQTDDILFLHSFAEKLHWAWILAIPTVGGLVVGIILLPVLLVAWFVLVIVAAVRASNGETYRYPLTIRFIS